jgi:hypothetical protein
MFFKKNVFQVCFMSKAQKLESSLSDIELERFNFYISFHLIIHSFNMKTASKIKKKIQLKIWYDHFALNVFSWQLFPGVTWTGQAELFA